MLDQTRDPIAPASLAPWLERYPANEPTNYTEPEKCPLVRLFTQLGFHNVQAVPNLVTYDGGQTEIPSEIEFILNAATYGEAAARARAVVHS